jgi:hypothetical protein
MRPLNELLWFLPPPGHPLRLAGLHELVQADLDARWRRAEPVTLEAYAEALPELGPAAELPAPLVYAEYAARCRHGDRPDVEAYRERFPGRYDDLLRLIREGLG